jgi:hypothetical protein
VAKTAPVLEQVNALSSAWMRIDMLPAVDQPPIRDLFKRYVDALRMAPESMGNQKELSLLAAKLGTLQNQIWHLCVESANRDGRPQVATLLLTALNESFDLWQPTPRPWPGGQRR